MYSGYIRGDDYWHNANRYQTAFEALQLVAGRTGKLWHRLEWESKADVIRQARAAGLEKLCWWCEEQELKPVRGRVRACGKCKSCETHTAGEWLCERKEKTGPK